MNVVFVLAGILAVLAAATAVTRESPIYAALFTLVTLAGVAVEFALLTAPFLAAMQILLYAGAIMVLFVFVIMLLSLKREEHGEEPPMIAKIFAALVAGGIFLFLYVGIRTYQPRSDWRAPDEVEKFASFAGPNVSLGSTEHFGHFLYGSQVVPFELVSVLLTAAVAGVMLLARKKAPGSDQAPAAKNGTHDHGHGHGGHGDHGHGAPEPPARQAPAAVEIHR